MQYYKQDLNNQITVLSLLAHGLPKAKTLAPINSNFTVLNDKMDEETGLIVNSENEDDALDIWDAANTTDIYSGYDEEDFLSGEASESYTQRILYTMANVLVPKEYHTNDCNATYVSSIHKAVIVNGTKAYIVDCHNAQAFIAMAYPKTKRMLNQIFINLLHEIAKKPIDKYTKALGALQTLWFMQAKKHHFHKALYTAKHSKKKQLPKDFKTLLHQLLIDITHYKKSKYIVKLTYQDLIDFYHEVQNGHITGKTHQVQEWLFSQHTTSELPIEKRKQVLNVMKLNPHFSQAVNGVKRISTSDADVQMIIAQMDKDKYIRRSKYHVVAAYTIKNHQKQQPGKKHFIGVHGTNSFSIPTILTDGLLSHNELIDAHNNHWVDNGQALGDGIYMSKLSQASKSLNFSNNDNSHYNWLIVADVAYSRPAHEDNYKGRPGRKDYDFIFGDKVGWAHNYDEFVARYGSQIKIKYILALSRHNK